MCVCMCVCVCVCGGGEGGGGGDCRNSERKVFVLSLVQSQSRTTIVKSSSLADTL